MNWQEYKTYHKNKYGTTSQHMLSQDYKAYKIKEVGATRRHVSPTRHISPTRRHVSPTQHVSPIRYEHALKTLPESRYYKTQQLERVSQRAHEGRGSPTRGWAAVAPQRGRERHDLKSRCGAKAFLDPEHEKFPVMSASRYNNKCEVSCQGVQAAYNRANQYKHFDIARKAEQLGHSHCGWGERTRSPRRSPGPIRRHMSQPRLRY
jgi:hypothetical protein